VPSSGAAVVRVVSWNVRSLRDSSSGVAAALRALEADVVLVQEAPRLLGWRVAGARLARRAGLRRAAGGRPGAGNLLLVGPRVVVRDARAVLLPRRRGLHRRGAVLGSLEVGGLGLAVVGTHLDLDPAARLDSARRVRALAPDGALVVGADVNETAGEPAWEVLAAGLVDAGRALGPTFPARAPHRRIDALLVDPALHVVAAQVPATGLVSDHLPVVVDLRAP
jgi:endonuclease/exonuclease/phosphatase family metal-dependent hydrolase